MAYTQISFLAGASRNCGWQLVRNTWQIATSMGVSLVDSRIEIQDPDRSNRKSLRHFESSTCLNSVQFHYFLRLNHSSTTAELTGWGLVVWFLGFLWTPHEATLRGTRSWLVCATASLVWNPEDRKDKLQVYSLIWSFPEIGVPQNGWLKKKHPAKIYDIYDLVCPHFRKLLYP